MKSYKGFTLIELVISIVVMGIMSTLVASAWANYIGVSKELKTKESIAEMQAIKNALIKFSELDNSGRLPAPYDGNGYNSSCIDIENNSLKSYLSSYTSTSIENINHDGSVLKNVRVCQVKRDVEYEKFISGYGGESVLLNYDIGVSYQTECPKNDSCNSGLPGDSDLFELSGWALSGGDSNYVEYSTLIIQQNMWDYTYANLIEIRNTMRNYRVNLTRTNSASSNINWNIAPSSSSSDKSGQNASSNQGCYDGWYDLSDSMVDVLTQYGLNKAVYSKTFFGGIVEYCRDFDFSDLGENIQPHLAAIRINKSVSKGLSPDNSDKLKNLIISF